MLPRILRWLQARRTPRQRLEYIAPWTVSRDAHARGMLLLRENLSPAQAHQFAENGCFEVVGCDTGKRYRIKPWMPANIEELDARGRRIRSWCFFPSGNLVTGDVLLAQKLALELFESEALAVANSMRHITYPVRLSF